MTQPTVILPVDPHNIQRIEVYGGEYATYVPQTATVYIVSEGRVTIFAVGDADDETASYLVLRRDRP